MLRPLHRSFPFSDLHRHGLPSTVAWRRQRVRKQMISLREQTWLFHVVSLVIAFWIGGLRLPTEKSGPSGARMDEATAAASVASECEVRTVRFDSEEVTVALVEHVERNIPLRLVGLPETASAPLRDSNLRDSVGGEEVELRRLNAGGKVPKRSDRKNATLAEALSGGPLASAWYAAQISLPKQLAELVPRLGAIRGKPLGALELDSPAMGMLGNTWAKVAGESLAASPYLYYYGGSSGAEDQGPGPALYMHYDAVDNFVHLVDGWKEFWLYDPFQAASVLYGSNKEHANGSPVDVEDLEGIARDFPLFKFALPRKCRIKAGEALYVPMYWFHRVRSSQNRTVALTYMNKGEPHKKGFFQKILCGYQLKPAAFECER